jgi:NAD(P)-dependent dehydrogenase (short-subunit alcohol dehydrogenase family)
MTTVLVTGANRGIGLELTRQLLDRGNEVIAVCRNPSPELQALGCRIEADVDVSSENLGGLPARLEGTPIDVLINNAGLLRRMGLDDLDVDAIREQYEVNAIAPLRLTQALLPNLKAGSKVAMVTSRMGSVADNTSGGHYGYRMSKAALNIATMSLRHDLAPEGIAVCVLHPGFVRTNMTGGMGLIDAPEAAAGLLARIDGLTMENTGSFWHANGESLPW